MMTSARVVEMSVNVTTNNRSQDYAHPDDHTSLTYLIDVPDKILSFMWGRLL